MACCEEIYGPNDELLNRFFDWAWPTLQDYVCNVHNFEEFGKSQETINQYDMMNDLYYIFVYLNMAYWDQEYTLSNLSYTAGDCTAKESAMAGIWSKYKFNCIIDYFKCKHKINLNTLLSSFGFDEDGITKGIDYMRIENTDICIPPFKIV